ncbi:MAG TPA: hypothetical protein VH643_08960 [Gemmataceae bacterium]|jgi:hypothetical protein
MSNPRRPKRYFRCSDLQPADPIPDFHKVNRQVEGVIGLWRAGHDFRSIAKLANITLQRVAQIIGGRTRSSDDGYYTYLSQPIANTNRSASTAARRLARIRAKIASPQGKSPPPTDAT